MMRREPTRHARLLCSVPERRLEQEGNRNDLSALDIKTRLAIGSPEERQPCNKHRIHT